MYAQNRLASLVLPLLLCAAALLPRPVSTRAQTPRPGASTSAAPRAQETPAPNIDPIAQATAEANKLAAAGQVNAAEQVLSATVQAARESNNLAFLRGALVALAEFDKTQGQFDQALTLFREARSVAERLTDPAWVNNCDFQSGEILLATGRFSDAARFFNAAQTGSPSSDNSILVAKCMTLLSIIALYQHNYPKAEDILTQSLMLSTLLHSQGGVAYCNLGLGLAHYQDGDASSANDCFSLSLAAARSLTDAGVHGRIQFFLICNLLGLALAEAELGQADPARQHFQEAMTRIDALPGKPAYALAFTVLGMIDREGGQMGGRGGSLPKGSAVFRADQSANIRSVRDRRARPVFPEPLCSLCCSSC